MQALQSEMAHIISPKRKFPILRLPFFAQLNVLLRLQLDDLIPLSFLSKRCKRMIRRALPSPKKAEYKCKVWLKEDSSIAITSRLGSYTGSSVDHILEVLSYPFIHVFFYDENATTSIFQWIKVNRNCIRRISFSTSLMNRKMILDLVNRFIELNVEIELDENMVVTYSPEEIGIENLNIFPISFLWSLNCQKLRIVGNVSPIVMAHRLTSSWALSDISASSTIKQLIFELKESEEIKGWILEYRWKKSEEELQYPIYGKIQEFYKMYHESRKVILFETHLDGKKLLVVDLEQYGLDI